MRVWKSKSLDELTDQNLYPGKHWFGFSSWIEWITDNRCGIAQIWHEIIYRLYIHHIHAYKHTTEIKRKDMDSNQSLKSYLLTANVSSTENFAICILYALLNLWYVMVHYTWSNTNHFFWHVQQMEYWQTYNHLNTLAFAMKFIDISPIHYPWKNLNQRYKNIHDNQNMLHEFLFLFFKCALIIVNKSTNKRASKCLAR